MEQTSLPSRLSRMANLQLVWGQLKTDCSDSVTDQEAMMVSVERPSEIGTPQWNGSTATTTPFRT